MSYLVLARKWRPQVFDDLVGQEAVVRVLKNAITQGRLAHAYVFSGPRGVGKTSTARILAKSLNCKDAPTDTPCGKCDSCVSIVESGSVDVIEIDGASNNSVDNIRDLRERVKYAPSSGEFKVYIIDEAHMLSTSAFNALLKTLEEPPPHVIFVLATTEAKKIPLTVLSRCQHMPFRRVSTQAIKDRLKVIVEAEEQIDATDGALALIARAADGSIRDSLTLLDQVSSFSQSIEEQDVKDLLDVADFSGLAQIADAVIEGRKEIIIDSVSHLMSVGTDLRTFTKDLIKFFRDLLVINLSKSTEGLLDASEDELKVLKKMSTLVSEEHLVLLLGELIKSETDVRTAFSPRVALEMSLLKISYLSTFRNVNEAISAIAKGTGPDMEYDIPFEATIKKPSVELEEDAPEEDAPEDDTPAATPIDTPAVTPKDAPIKEPTPPQAENETPVKGEPQETEEENESIREMPATGKFTGATLLSAVSNKIGPLMGTKLSRAHPELEGNVLSLSFNSSEAEICAKTFMDDPSKVEEVASSLMGAPVKLKINIKAPPKTTSRKNIKEKAMSDPVVKEAMDLFDSRIVDIKRTDEN